MAKQSTSTAVPRLRFPEFREAAKWRATSLGEVLNSEASAVALNKLTLQTTGYPVYGADGLVGYIDNFAQDCGYIAIVKDGSGVGRLAMLPAKSSVLGTLAYLKSRDDEKATLDWLFYCLSALDLRKYVKGSGIPHIYYSDYANEVVGVPSPAEQQKVAGCLTSLDEVIAAQGREVEALKAHKRGLMQQLFPREGETRPRLRFPEFRNAPEWMEVSIGGMGEVITGSTPATSRRDYYGGDHLFVSPADISDSRFVETTKTNLTEAGFAQARVVKARSVLFVCIGSTIGKVAQNVRDCATNQQINAIVANSEFSGDFVYCLLDMESERIAGLAGRQAVPIINKTLFSSVNVRAPKIGEQQRIADCLSSLDTQITADTNQLAALKIHKQGLMQQLFPAPDAASA